MDTLTQGWGDWEKVTQRGKDTGNDEDQDYRPENCQERGKSMFLVLCKEPEHWYSGKIRSKKTLVEMAPDGGELEVVVQGPNLQFHDGRRCRFAHSLWPAVWLLPSNVPWPTGSECDLLELMMHTYDDCNKGFSTLHWGPYRGRDIVTRGSCGLHLGSYVWDEGDHSLRFRWERRADRAWVLSFWVDDRHVWRFATAKEGILAATHEGYGEGFREGQPGDACVIIQRAFDEPERSYHIIANLALGGRPFGRRSHDELKMADFVVKGVRVRPLSEIKG